MSISKSTNFSINELSAILLDYDLGELLKSKIFSGGSVQTNIMLQTTMGKFVFRYYRQDRLKESVLFETNLCNYLKKNNYPCPAPLKDKFGRYVGTCNNKPFVIFEFMEGRHINNPNRDQKRELIKKVAELQIITKDYKPLYKNFRSNYDIGVCRKLAGKKAKKIDTLNSMKKLEWHSNELSKLKLPKSLPRGICHCDFHFTNVLFYEGKFNALIDFDDANYTFLAFDLIWFIEPLIKINNNKIDFRQAKEIVWEYNKHRPLNNSEKRHLFDLYKLSILFDCVWYFERGEVADFYEKRKIDRIESLGRENFYDELFG